MADKGIIEKYAALLVRFGVALKKGQRLVVEIPSGQRLLAEAITASAKRLGADTVVFYRDDEEDAACWEKDPRRFQMCQQQEKAKLEKALEGDAVSLAFLSPNPRLDKEWDDTEKKEIAAAKNDLRNVVRRAIRGRKIHWCYACVPNPDWAKWLFPELDKDAAGEKLWDVLADLCLLKEGDPLQAWLECYADLYRHTERLNGLSLSKIHFTNRLGTDLEVGVNPDCIWEGGIAKESYTPDFFQCNLPSYEVCTTTDRMRTNGIVYASKPLYVNGGVIDGFHLEFQDGKVVSYGAKKGKSLLESILSYDAGSRYLGEVAFVDKDTPIAKSGLVFLNSLLDENAACHLALGEGFPGNIRGIDPSDPVQVEKSGVNRSGQHVDFMFGTEDLCADGYMEEGQKVPLFRDGKFV